MYPAAPLFELKEGLRIGDATLLADAPPKLGKIEDVVTDSTFVTENPGDKAHDGEGADDLGGDCDRGVGVPLHVGQDFGSAAGVPRGGVNWARGDEARERRDGGCGECYERRRGEDESTHWRHQVAGESERRALQSTAGTWMVIPSLLFATNTVIF
jgi:hypothetical protein